MKETFTHFVGGVNGPWAISVPAITSNHSDRVSLRFVRQSLPEHCGSTTSIEGNPCPFFFPTT